MARERNRPIKLASKLFGAVALLALLFGIITAIALVKDSCYYYRIHDQMKKCYLFVDSHLEANRQFPDTEVMQAWCLDNGVSPRFQLAAKGNDLSFKNLEGNHVGAEQKNYRIAYWDGDRNEFFNAWDSSFTTSKKLYLGKLFLVSFTGFCVSIICWLLRSRLKKKATQ